MGRRQRPSGEIWATHISGEMPAGHRRTLLEELRNLDEETRGFISNCACLGEGVDVPTLDGIAFIDPKRSMVDIIQAVGRVIRKDPSGKKNIGTIVIPVFVDESADAEKAMSSSAFEPVWQVLRALRAHDQALADELDSIRTKLGKQVAPGRKVQLPSKISIDVPELVFKNFERAFYARAIERSTALPPITVEKILQFADEHHNSTGEWPNRKTGGGILAAGETWGAIDTALKDGNRGLPKGSSLARLLAENRGVRNVQELAPLTKEQILVWVDHHFARTGRWPDRKAGKIQNAPSETWAFINSALIFGSRSLPQGSSLAKLLAAERDVRNQSALPALTIDRVLEWADAAFQRNGRWPLRSSGSIREAPHETWSGVNTALTRGLRGLPGGVSLTQLLARERGIRNIQELPDLSVDQILKFADAHFDRTGKWPTHLSGPVAGAPGETWAGIHGALVRGRRGLPGGSSLAKFLAKNRGYRNRLALPNLSYDIILAWADSYHAKIKRWPNINSGEIREAPGENWKTVDNTLRQGNRGLPGGSSLAKLLAQERGVKNRKNAPLTIHYILELADLYRLQTGNWPTEQSGLIPGSGGDTWNAISSALLRGARGLPRIGSLAKLLAQERGVRNVRDLPELTIEKILLWADDHYRRTGKWPNVKSGDVYGVIGENWANIGAALSSGGRNLPRVGSLAKMIAKERGARNLGDLPELTIQMIISWADDHHRRTGKWPSKGSGDVYTVRGEKWGNINRALSSGGRGLLGGSSLAILLREHRGAKSESTWESLYNELVKYKKRVGNCDVPRGSLEHRRLSLWLGKQRQNYRNGRLSDDRASQLERLGIRWNPIDEAWEKCFNELERFREGYGHCLVSQNEAKYRQLARWVTRQRQDNKRGRLMLERKRRLDDIGFVWDENQASWEESFEALAAYKQIHGDTNVQRYSKDDRLARWLQKQRYARSRGRLPEAREVRLAELGVIWNTKDKYWDDMLAALRRYKIANGDCLVTQKYSENTQLAQFVEFQRIRRKKAQLNDSRVKELDDLGFVWDARSAFTDKMLAELIAFKEKYGHCSVPQTYEGNRQLAVWVANCRNYRRKGTLDPKLERQLVLLGFEWRGNRKGVPKTAH